MRRLAAVRVGAFRAVTGLVAGAVLVAGCSHPTAPAPGRTPPAPTGDPSVTASGPAAGTDWTTYHHDNARTGLATGFPTVRTLRTAWRADLDGAVYGQPLVVGGTVLAATENDTVYGLDAHTGAVRWSTHLGTPVPRSGLPCGDIDPLGITGTMVYDPDSATVFAVAETTGGRHTLAGLDVATGAVRLRREVEPPQGNRLAHQQRSALNLLDGRVYIAYGGLAGDCGEYIGSVVSAPTTGSGPLASYAIPTSREGGIWSPGGASVQGGRLLYAAGNGESVRGGYDGSDSVVALDPGLKLVDRFAPSTWADDNEHDLDLGSMTPAVVNGYVLIAGKRGTGYVLRAGHLGGLGGQVSLYDVCQAFGGAAVAGDTVYLPCTDGPRALRVDPAGQAHLVWHAAVPAKGAPVVGGGVWVVDYDAGRLYVLDEATGQPRASLSIGTAPHFASPTLAGGTAYVGTLSGVVAVAAG